MPACPRWCPGALMLGEEAVQLRAGRTAAFRWVEVAEFGLLRRLAVAGIHVADFHAAMFRRSTAGSCASTRPTDRCHYARVFSPNGNTLPDAHASDTDPRRRAPPMRFQCCGTVLGTDRRHPVPTQPGPDRAKDS
jgi:hypothetical protein